MKNIVRRNFFQEGDIVVGETGTPFYYVEAKGFNETVVIPLDRETLEFIEDDGISESMVLVNATLHFHPNFNPGQTHISNR